jgi:hypothetical protein
LTPATSTASAIGLRDCSGSSAMRAASMTVPRSALLVSSSGASEETLIVSVRAPTGSCMLTVATCPTSNRMFVRVAFWKPASSTVSV